MEEQTVEAPGVDYQVECEQLRMKVTALEANLRSVTQTKDRAVEFKDELETAMAPIVAYLAGKLFDNDAFTNQLDRAVSEHLEGHGFKIAVSEIVENMSFEVLVR